MQAIEIILLVGGAAAFVISFLLPDKRDKAEETQSISREELRQMLEEEVEASRTRIEDMTEETIAYAMEKSERSLDRIANEKMMALGEYSDTVLNQINQNHQGTVFLHDMLNKNKEELTKLMNQASTISRDANLRANEAYDLAGSAKRLAEEAYGQAEDAGKTAELAKAHLVEARKMIEQTANLAKSRRDELMAAAEPEAEEPKEEGEFYSSYEETPEAEYEEPDVEQAEEEEPVAEHEDEEEQEESEVSEEEEPDYHHMTAMERIAALKARPHPAGETGTALKADAQMAASKEERLKAVQDRIVRIENRADNERRTAEEQRMDAALNGARSHAGERVVSGIARTAASESAVGRSDTVVSRSAAAETAVKMLEKAAENVEKPRRKRSSRSGSSISFGDLFPETRSNKDVAVVSGGGEGKSSKERILEMHKLGRSNMAIAKELGIGIGEVKLVIDLYNNT